MKKLWYMALKMGPRGAVDAHDLVQAAAIRLLRARSTFDPQRSSWKTYALLRARGAMLDELRAVDHVPRLERARARRAGRELPQVLSIQTGPTDQVSRDPGDRGAADPLALATDVDLWREAVRILGPRSGRLIFEYYRRGRTLRQIGDELGLSESRACQLFHRAIARLRARWRGGVDART